MTVAELSTFPSSSSVVLDNLKRTKPMIGKILHILESKLEISLRVNVMF